MKKRLARLWSEIRHVAVVDLSLFRGRRRLLLAVLGATLVPAAYATIYLRSAWDPFGHLSDLPVALVQLDRGGDARGEHLNLGESVVELLEAKPPFAFRRVPDEAAARAMVSSGDVFFAVVLPPELTARVLAADHAEPGQVRVIYSEGNNYMSGTIAKRFAGELTAGINHTVGEKRWAAVLGAVMSSKSSLGRLRDGVSQLRDGAHQLDDGLGRAEDGVQLIADGSRTAHAGAVALANGAAQVDDGTRKLTTGVEKIGAGLRTMDEKLPKPEQLDRLAKGAQAVADGNAKLEDGLGQLADGTEKARAGAQTLAEKTKKIPIVGGRVSAGAGQLQDGLGQLEAGAQRAQTGSAQLADGSAQVAKGTAQLTEGVQKLGDGVHTMATKLPEDATLERLADGSHQIAGGAQKLQNGLGRLSDGTGQLEDGVGRLHDGAGKLSAGLDKLAAALPADVEGPGGDAQGLTSSVEPEFEALTTISAYGTSMAPYFTGLSLWVGVVMASFMFQLRWFSKTLRRVSRPALFAGRMFVPLLMTTGQATLLTLALRFPGGHRAMPQPIVFWFLTVLTSAVFLSIVMMLLGLIGDPGKVAALLLLIFQMASSGGIFPVQLSGGVYAASNPYLPFTWVLRAYRAALFGAYDGTWGRFALVVLAFGLGAAAITALFARWKFVTREGFVPALDV